MIGRDSPPGHITREGAHLIFDLSLFEVNFLHLALTLSHNLTNLEPSSLRRDYQPCSQIPLCEFPSIQDLHFPKIETYNQSAARLRPTKGGPPSLVATNKRENQALHKMLSMLPEVRRSGLGVRSGSSWNCNRRRRSLRKRSEMDHKEIHRNHRSREPDVANPLLLVNKSRSMTRRTPDPGRKPEVSLVYELHRRFRSNIFTTPSHPPCHL
jgi:hypothetical protein